MPSWMWAVPAKEGITGIQADVCQKQFIPVCQCLVAFPAPGIKSPSTDLVCVLSVLLNLGLGLRIYCIRTCKDITL